MTKEELINSIIDKNQYKSYLEIGTAHGNCYKQIKCDNKTGIDPEPVVIVENLHIETSDDFFNYNKDKFDIIFIDGYHESIQVLADIINAATYLENNGTIVIHDILPTSELTQRVPRESKEWYGDVWKAWYLLLNANYDINLTSYDFDCGIGTITLGRQGLDDLLCGFSDNIEKLKEISYNKDFDEYLKLILK